MVAVPIAREDRVWGRLDVFAGAGEAAARAATTALRRGAVRPGGDRVGRAELFSQLERSPTRTR
jgi:hypothetical protein